MLDIIRNSDYIDELYHEASGDDPKLVITKLIEMLDEFKADNDRLVDELSFYETNP